MSVRTGVTPKGALVYLRILVEARDLEECLETLAELPYPLNPQIFHRWEGTSKTAIEVPAYEGWLSEIREALLRSGFPAPAGVTPATV
ncbi:MAG: hypothetical protein U0Q16_23740 [Bryobacteraceae bacterium]